MCSCTVQARLCGRATVALVFAASLDPIESVNGGLKILRIRHGPAESTLAVDSSSQDVFAAFALDVQTPRVSFVRGCVATTILDHACSSASLSTMPKFVTSAESQGPARQGSYEPRPPQGQPA